MLEDGAEGAGEISSKNVLMASIALSLIRIADAIENLHDLSGVEEAIFSVASSLNKETDPE